MKSKAIVAAMLATSASFQLAMAQDSPVADAPEAGTGGAAADPVEAASGVSADAAAPAPYPDSVNGSPAPSPAAEEAAPEADKAGDGLEEVIVTAQKRAESLQDVPIAIQAFTGADLDSKGVTDTQQLQTSTPGMVYDTLGAFSIIYVRGVGTDAFIPSADLSVATYVDGVYFPFSVGLAKAFGAVERIEILKGPQGTLFGRNSTGGAISVVTRQPTETWTGDVQTGIGNFNETRSRAYMSGPLTDTLSVGIGVLYNYKDDYYKIAPTSIQTGLQPTQDKGVNAKIRWAPDDSFDATATGYYFDSRGVGTSLFNQINPSPAGKALGLTTQPDYTTSDNVNSSTSSNNRVGSLVANYRPGPFDLKSITADQRLRATEQSDFDGTDLDVVDFRGGVNEAGRPDKSGPGLLADTFTQELQILSNDESWGAGTVKWVGGLYFLKSKAGFDPVDISVGGLGDISTFTGGVLVPVPVPLLTLINSVTGQVVPPAGGYVRATGLLGTTAYAGFAEGTYTPIHWLDVTLGLRYSTEKRRVYDAQSSLVATTDQSQTETVTPLMTFADQQLTGTNLSPKIVVGAHPTSDSLVFLSYQIAHKSGSFNVLALTEAPTRIRPEKVSAVELGGKSEFFDHKLRLNSSIFYNRITDLQSQFFSLLSGGVVSFQNAPKAHIFGQELSVDWSVVSGLLFNASFSHLDGIYDKFPNAKGFDPTTGLLTSTNDNSGNTIARNPKYTLSTGLNYTLPVADGMLAMGGDFYYNSGFFYDAQNQLKQKSYSLLDARVSYLYLPWNLRLSAFVNNLANEKRYAFEFQFDFGTLGKLDEPRTYFLQADYSF